MTTAHSKLALSLRVLAQLQTKDAHVVRSGEISRTHLQRLVAHGFLRKVLRGWYIPSTPGEHTGETTPWFVSYWPFISAYANHRFGNLWTLAPEPSLRLHAGNFTVPTQLLLHAAKANNAATALLHGTSLLEVRAKLPPPSHVELIEGVRVHSAASALLEVGSGFFARESVDAQAVVRSFTDTDALLAELLDGGKAVVAGRLVGAFHACGREEQAQRIQQAMAAAGYALRVKNPFSAAPFFAAAAPASSPVAVRIRALWQQMRPAVLAHAPLAGSSALPLSADYLDSMDRAYAADAYHSLSIEGYRVSPELIERVQSSDWNPTADRHDRGVQDALAARGYYEAFEAVKRSVEKIVQGTEPAHVAREDHSVWYRCLFSPSVAVGSLKPSDLAGYRHHAVYIRNSRHVPTPAAVVPEALTELFALLAEEPDAWVRAVLGHFLFVFIHPYPDGNGRVGRLLMNLMLASGGYPWTIIPVHERDPYMSALEQASVKHTIEPFATFLAALVGQ